MKVPFKVEQVAMATSTPQAHMEMLSNLFGLPLSKWIKDTVVTEGSVRGVVARTTADLYFNYDLIKGIEFELLHYKEGPNWLNGHEGISHFGTHVRDMAWSVQRVKEAMGWDIVQDVKTISHTNPYLLEQKRKYHYVIFAARHALGADFKLIQRIQEG